MAYGPIKLEMTGTGGTRYRTRAEAKTASKKQRRKNDRRVIAAELRTGKKNGNRRVQ